MNYSARLEVLFSVQEGETDSRGPLFSAAHRLAAVLISDLGFPAEWIVIDRTCVSPEDKTSVRLRIGIADCPLSERRSLKGDVEDILPRVLGSGFPAPRVLGSGS